MQRKTILNRVEKHRSLVYGAVRLYEQEGRPALDVELRPRANGRATCSGCSRRRPGYDTLSPRRFELWQPYLKVIARKAADAVQVLDRFHLMAHLSKAGISLKA
jgi:hypothetical protein